MARLARSAEIIRNPDGSGIFRVDGAEFPWYISREVDVEVVVDAVEPLHLVTVQLLVDGDVAIDGFDAPPDEAAGPSPRSLTNQPMRCTIRRAAEIA